MRAGLDITVSGGNQDFWIQKILIVSAFLREKCSLRWMPGGLTGCEAAKPDGFQQESVAYLGKSLLLI